LESLKAVAALSLFPDYVKDGVDEFSSLCVVTLGPVVTGSALSEHKVVWSEDLSEWSRSDGVHGTWLKIDEDCTWYIFATGGFIVVNVDSLELEVRVTVVGTSGVNTVLV
jgi:hypothetical protein